MPRRDSAAAAEFGCNETAANVHHAANFMRQTMALMDSDTRVVRWAPAHRSWPRPPDRPLQRRSCVLR